jgi:hypothetical protein
MSIDTQSMAAQAGNDGGVFKFIGGLVLGFVLRSVGGYLLVSQVGWLQEARGSRPTPLPQSSCVTMLLLYMQRQHQQLLLLVLSQYRQAAKHSM